MNFKRGFLKGGFDSKPSKAASPKPTSSIRLPTSKPTADKVLGSQSTSNSHTSSDVGIYATLQAIPMTYMTLPPRAAGDESNEYAECYISETVRDIVLNTPGFPRTPIQPPSLKYRIGKAPEERGPDAGLAMYAICDIMQGELLFSERPLSVSWGAIVPRTPLAKIMDMGFTSADQFNDLLFRETEETRAVVVHRMPKANREAYLALANSHKHDGSGLITGISRTNSFALGINEPGVESKFSYYGGVCNHASRMNHSCRPNIGRHFDVASFSFRFYAMRDIAKGEEATTAYCDTRDLYAERQTALRPYGFTCTCTACTDRATSEKRRAMISEPDYMHTTRSDPLLGPLLANGRRTGTNGMIFLPVIPGFTPPIESTPELTRDEFIKETRRQIALMEQEGLEAHDHYAGHLLVLSRVLDQEPNADRAELEALIKKVELLRAANGKQVSAKKPQSSLDFDNFDFSGKVCSTMMPSSHQALKALASTIRRGAWGQGN